MGSLSLLQGIFPTQGSNPGPPTLQADSLPSEPPGKEPTCQYRFLPIQFPGLSVSYVEDFLSWDTAARGHAPVKGPCPGLSFYRVGFAQGDKLPLGKKPADEGRAGKGQLCGPGDPECSLGKASGIQVWPLAIRELAWKDCILGPITLLPGNRNAGKHPQLSMGGPALSSELKMVAIGFPGCAVVK